MKKESELPNNNTSFDWLLTFEKHIGKPCVVSLLIENGEVNFISCLSKKRMEELKEEEDYFG